MVIINSIMGFWLCITIIYSGDHTEVIELDYDPKGVTYEELLDIFWANHEYGLTTKLKRQVREINSISI